MLTFGSVVFILIGVAFFVGGALLANNKRKKKSMLDRAMDVFKDYERDMDKFRS